MSFANEVSGVLPVWMLTQQKNACGTSWEVFNGCLPCWHCDLPPISLNQILPCEPLHDLKGHIAHVMTEIRHHVEKEVATTLGNIINSTVGETNRGCDWRKALFLACLATADCHECPSKVRRLLRLLAEIAQIAYARADRRSPKMILHLSLCLWRHAELLVEVVGEPKAISLGSLFGSYLHDLLHSADQLAVISLSSTNTEILERLQGQARKIAEATSSRRANEVILNTLLRIQAEGEKTRQNLIKEQTTVRSLGEQLSPLGCTVIHLDTLENATNAKKANMEQLFKNIAQFLQHGPGIWWHSEASTIFFHDGHQEPTFR